METKERDALLAQVQELAKLRQAATPGPWLLTTINTNPRGLAMYQQVVRATDTGQLGGLPVPKTTMQLQFAGAHKTRYASDGDILAHEPDDATRANALFLAAAGSIDFTALADALLPPLPTLGIQGEGGEALRELVRLRAAATPGPWAPGTTSRQAPSGNVWPERAGAHQVAMCKQNPGPDAAFIAAAGSFDFAALLEAAAPTVAGATSQWVPVGEELPAAIDDYSSRVLCFGDGGIDGSQFVGYYCPSLKLWFLAHDNQPVMTVTHWQLLPTPPVA